MTVFEFMNESPMVSFLLALIVGEVVTRIACTLPNRILRHWNIHKHGYPPPYCDADGDFQQTRSES